MLIINTSTTPTTNVYNTLPSIYNYDNVGSGNIRQTGAFMNYGGTVTLADTALVHLYESNSMPFGHFLFVMSSDQAAYGIAHVNWRYRNTNLDSGFTISTLLITNVGVAIAAATNSVSTNQMLRLTNNSGATRTFYWSILSLTG